MGVSGREREKTGVSIDDHVESLAGGGGAIMAALIIGGAILVAGFILWEMRLRAGRQAEMAQLEEKAFGDLRLAYQALMDGDPGAALAKAADATDKSKRITELSSRADHRVFIVARLLSAEAFWVLGGEENLEAALASVDHGMALMTQSGGGLWESLYYARARIRYDLGLYGSAVIDLTAVLDYNPGFASAYYWRALAMAALGNAESARADEKKARNLGAWPPEKDFRRAYQGRIDREPGLGPGLPESGAM
ncbi:MAG: hypothetical protein LBJ46_00065 [Planctomycetota bacterium]|jgi:tetratricopeptide (TPR) repeat protein|nr:hypothetical protein [Planctomycetota bacterium]